MGTTVTVWKRILLLLHINDLPICIQKEKTVFLADDTNILREATYEDILITK
jgi:hypothetical protein